jgi:DNA-binding beta-propeller fold protein YncE
MRFVKGALAGLAAAGVALVSAAPIVAFAEPPSFLGTIHRHVLLASTVPDNGDLNPYAVVVAPVSAGKVEKGDVLVDNFNDRSNLQGTGSTIIDYRPATGKTSVFALLPHQIKDCPGGVGLTAAMAMLKSGWVIVGSTPSTDGTAKTKGAGCLILLNAEGKLVGTIMGPRINGPWGNIAVIDRGSNVTLFISMLGDLPAPSAGYEKTGKGEISHKANVLRLELQIKDKTPPVVTSETVIADGFGARADKDAFLIGPTGVALAPDGKTLYVSDAVDNRVVAIADAPTRTASAGTGREISKDGLLKRPLALVTTPSDHLLVVNALNGQVVEIDPAAGTQLKAQWLDNDQAQTPPGNGDLFGIAMKPDGAGFFYVEDDVNTLMEAKAR